MKEDKLNFFSLAEWVEWVEWDGLAVFFGAASSIEIQRISNCGVNGYMFWPQPSTAANPLPFTISLSSLSTNSNFIHKLKL